MDDMIFARKNRAIIAELKKKLEGNFAMEELGKARHTLRTWIDEVDHKRY